MRRWILRVCLVLSMLLFLFVTISCTTNSVAKEKPAANQNQEEKIKEKQKEDRLGEKTNGWIILLDYQGDYLFKSSAIDFRESDGIRATYVYWYDTEGNFYQWNGNYLFSSKNMEYHGGLRGALIN